MNGRTPKAGILHHGEILELQPPSRIVHVERRVLPERMPDNHVETRFDPDGTGTLMTMRMTLPDAKTRAAMLATGMKRGMEASYAPLEGMIQRDEFGIGHEPHGSIDIGSAGRLLKT